MAGPRKGRPSNTHLGCRQTILRSLQCRVVKAQLELPENLRDFEVILIDPMLATGGSTIAAFNLLADRGAKRIRMVNLIAAPEGIAQVRKHCGDFPIFTASIDRALNKKGYILPGLGDAGDRLFGI